MGKTEVYSWRISPETKSALESQARREGASLAALMDRITREWLQTKRASASDDVEQARLHAAAAATFGRLSRGGSRRAETAREAVRERLVRRRAR